jgi:hypothetical protein
MNYLLLDPNRRRSRLRKHKRQQARREVALCVLIAIAINVLFFGVAACL